jgi:GAF domain-containing protein
MLDQSLLLRTLSRFAQALPAPYDVAAMLSDLAESVTGVLGLSGSGVTLEADGRLVFVTAGGSHLEQLERVQERNQAGPCWDAFRSGDVIAVSDLDTVRDRWPEYTDTADELGVTGVAGIPMRLADRSFGALNLYSSVPRIWPEEELDAARVLADVATSYLVNASKVRQLEQLTEQLQHALDSRVVIEQAKGVVATRDGIGVDDAYDRIRHHARSHNATVRTVADAIVTLGLQI